MMGSLSPAMVCIRVIQPDMKKIVPITAARSSGVPAAVLRPFFCGQILLQALHS